jgi:DNA polymerase-1
MVLIHAEFAARGLKTAILLQIHDELVFDVPLDEQDEVFAIVKDKMEHAVPFETPLVIEGGFGNNLFEVK